MISLLIRAVHQLLKDAIEFVEVSVAGDEGAGLEAAAGNQVERLAADGRRVVEGGAQRDVAVVNAVGVERDVGAHGASAEEVDGAAFAHHFDGFFPGFGDADGFNGDIDAAIFGRESASFADGLANAAWSGRRAPRPVGALLPPGRRA